MTPQTQTQLAVPVNAQDHSRGPKDAPITLVEYGDLSARIAQAHYQLQELEKAIGESIRLVFREFPLTTVHPHAVQAAEAAESAGAQRKFWPMHDILFENQDVPRGRRFASVRGRRRLGRRGVRRRLEPRALLPPSSARAFHGRRSQRRKWYSDIFHQRSSPRRRIRLSITARGNQRAALSGVA